MTPAQLRPGVTRRFQSANCWFGRPYGPPIAFVVHTQSGGESGTVAELLSSAAYWSAHYVVGLDGSLECRIDPTDRAWSNGIIEPGNRWTDIARECGVDPALDPNHVTVTCETEDLGDASQPVTDQQYDALLRAAWDAKLRYPDSLRYLARHADISPQSRPGCPGDRWLSSGRFQALAEALGLKTVAGARAHADMLGAYRARDAQVASHLELAVAELRAQQDHLPPGGGVTPGRGGSGWMTAFTAPGWVPAR